MHPTGALLTDLYQLTMFQPYLEQGMTDTAVFALFFVNQALLTGEAAPVEKHAAKPAPERRSARMTR